MELGNAIFGNSRGTHPIERNVGWEEQLTRLFDVYAPARSNGWREYGVNFENEVFVVREYYWGDCDCGYEAKGYYKGKHKEDCYQSELKKQKLKAGWFESDEGGYLKPPLGLSYEGYSKKEREIMEPLCKKYGLLFPYGCAVHCTCDMPERIQKWHEEIGYPDGCLDTCSTHLANFQYKPIDFRIEWYKYPLRDSYMNQEISLDDFRELIDKCIESIPMKQRPPKPPTFKAW